MITFGQVSQFGALATYPEVRALQQFLAQQGKLAASQVTGQMDDATMSVLYSLLRENLAFVAKLDALPSEVRAPIRLVRTAIEGGDSLIKTATFGKITLKQLIDNFAKAMQIANAAVGLGVISQSTVDKIVAKRDEIYNTVGGQAKWIQKGLAIAMGLAAMSADAGGGAGATPGGKVAVIFPGLLTVPATQVPSTTPAKAVPFVGCVFRYNKTRKKYVIYCRPNAANGLGVADERGECLYGSCELGADTAVTPPPPPGMVETAAVDSPTEAGAAAPAGEEDVPLYKRPLFWVAVAGAAAVGAGGVVLWRRKSKAPAPAAGFGRFRPPYRSYYRHYGAY
jgi:hypothetical protein